MTKFKSVDDYIVEDDAGDYLNTLADDERLPRFKSNKLGDTIKFLTDEERVIGQSLGYAE